jgi:SRSO17 transposase
MERRFEVRKEELLADCQVPPEVFSGIIGRLERFAQPYIACLRRPEQRVHAQTYVQGLLSDLKRKNAEAIAYRHDEDRQGLQTFIGTALWDHQPLLDQLARQVGEQLGEPDGVIVFDPAGFPKKGCHSVGVARQWCGRLGKVDNCQVAILMGYVSRGEHALVNVRLYLPQDWTKNKKRLKACGVPKETRFRTRHQLALDMLEEQGHLLPHSWVTGDDEMGRPAWFRRELDRRGERYLLGVPSHMTIRDLEGETPPYRGRGRRRKRRFEQVRAWCESLPEEAWIRLEVRDGAKGPLEVEIVKRRVVAKIDRKVGHKETFVAIRTVGEEGVVKHDYYLSNGSPETPLKEFARVTKAEHRIEECIKRGKSESGLADYQVRTWLGWHHHVTLSMIAAWFLVVEARRGEKVDPGNDRSANPRTPRPNPEACMAVRQPRSHQPRMHPLARTQRARQILLPSST